MPYKARYTPLLPLLLVSCQAWSWSDTADALMPDEFTMGQGSSSMDTHTTGGYIGHNDMYAYEGEGEGESTYAALTWHLPSVKSDNGMSRETQRNFALLVDHMVAEEGIEAPAANDPATPAAASGPLKLNLREGVELPSPNVLLGVLGVFLSVLLVARYKSKRRRSW